MTVYYKLTTSKPIDVEMFKDFAQKLGCSIVHEGSDRLEMISADGSIYGVRRTPDCNFGYAYMSAIIYFECDSVQIGHISRFGRFCARNELGLRRNGTELDEGTLLSNVMDCEAFRIASHAAAHPNDLQSNQRPPAS